MESVLVVKNDVYLAKTGGGIIADASELNLLAPGALAMLTPDGAVVPAAGFGASTETLFQMVLQTEGGGLIRTPLIERASFSEYLTAYTAAVEKEMTITFTGGTVTAGKSVGLAISRGEYVTPINGKDYEDFVIGVGAGDSVDNMVAKLAAEVNAGSDLCTASASTNVLTLTGKSGAAFNASGMFEFEEFTTAITTQYVAGSGLGAWMVETELKGSAHKGNARSKSFGYELYKQPTQASASGTYSYYTMTWQLAKRDQLNSKDAPYNQLAMLSTLTGNTTLLGVLVTILASV